MVATTSFGFGRSPVKADDVHICPTFLDHIISESNWRTFERSYRHTPAWHTQSITRTTDIAMHATEGVPMLVKAFAFHKNKNNNWEQLAYAPPFHVGYRASSVQVFVAAPVLAFE